MLRFAVEALAMAGRKLAGREHEVIDAFNAGATYSELAEQFDVSKSTIGRILREIAPNSSRRRGRPRKLNGSEQEVLDAFRSGMTAHELRPSSAPAHAPSAVF